MKNLRRGGLAVAYPVDFDLGAGADDCSLCRSKSPVSGDCSRITRDSYIGRQCREPEVSFEEMTLLCRYGRTRKLTRTPFPDPECASHP